MMDERMVTRVGRISEAWKLHGIPRPAYTVRCHCGREIERGDPYWKGARCEPCGVVYRLSVAELLPCGCEHPWDHITSVCYTWLAATPREVVDTSLVPHHCLDCKGRGETRAFFNMPSKDDPLGSPEPPRVDCTPCPACGGTGRVLSDEPGVF